MENIQSTVRSIQKIYLEYPVRYERANEEHKKVNEEIQDLLHVLELGSLNAVQLSKISRDLKKARMIRRQLKNEIEILNHIVRFVRSPNKPNKQRINSMIGNVSSVLK